MGLTGEWTSDYQYTSGSFDIEEEVLSVRDSVGSVPEIDIMYVSESDDLNILYKTNNEWS